VPQKPERTWQVRYGDCKAKTLLLLAILHAMNIDAEPVLANASLGDFVPDRLPSLAAFNHILVRATIGGETFWLDGTGSGSRLADIRDTPPLGHVLPVRSIGAGLVTIATHANARPTIDLSIDADESASVDLPTALTATAIIRGGRAALLTVAQSQLGEKEQREAVGGFFQGFLGQMQISSATIKPDPVAGNVTLVVHGVTTTPWFDDERKRKRGLTQSMDRIDFTPDRGRPNWTTIPVATPAPYGMHYRLRLKLPDGGQGYAIEGEPDMKASFAGFNLGRTTVLVGNLLTLDEKIDATGSEIPAGQIPSERDKVATAKARAPRIVAPANARRRWDLAGSDPAGATQVAAVDSAFGKAIANDPDEISGYVSRASFREGIGDRRGAHDDLTRAIAIAPSVELYLRRAASSYEMGDLTASNSDAEAARKLDPSSGDAIGRVAWIKAARDDLPGAIKLLDERIAMGGDTRPAYALEKASIIGEFGDPAVAIRLFDTLIAEKPGSPSLMNARCWVKGTRSVMLDTALRDCTSALELSSDPTPILDSRAMVWYRLGRFDDSLRDLDAVLAATPGIAQSHFLRGVVLLRMHRDAEASREFLIARRITPSIQKTNERFGIKI
ncbi:tetratricopeptide repeat protein, partial [Sphingomonas sp.]|uniref:tetratricopeptide repeat protein n=1 Tax=Sphingomonas sp. TaxID=28214 RepID=UPI0025E0F2DC